MKVLILANHLNIGGITRYVFLLAKGLIELKNKVWVAAQGELQEELSELGVEVLNIDLKIKSELDWRVPKVIYKLRKYFIKEKPDIIHANNRTNSIIAYYLSKFLNVPYITTCHGLYRIRWTRVIFPFVGRYVIAISNEVKKQLVKGLKIEERKIKLIYNGIDLDYFCPEKVKVRKSDFGFKEGDFILGNISRLENIKGQDILILAMPEILKEIPEAKLILIGDGKYRSFIEKKIKELNLTQKVFLLGGQKDVRSFLKIMDVFCFLPSYEPFGLSLLEAMAMRIPIICSDVSELSFILGDSGIVISSRRPQDLVYAVVDLYKNREKREMFSFLAHQRAQRFSYKRTVEETLEVYQLARYASEKNSYF